MQYGNFIVNVELEKELQCHMMWWQRVCGEEIAQRTAQDILYTLYMDAGTHLSSCSFRYQYCMMFDLALIVLVSFQTSLSKQ